jgi:hypothetical protein
MAKYIIITIAVFSSTFTFGQSNFQWERIDSIAKTKNEIYSLTKMFIAETWKSAQNVIQNDDKDGGLILVKGASIQKKMFMGGEYNYVYNYSVTFRMRDNKYKITLDNVYCESAYMSSGRQFTKIQPFDGDNCPETGTFAAPGLPKKKAIEMMNQFRSELENLINLYPEFLKREIKKEDW